MAASRSPRVQYLDGLRGLAIFLVLCFHYLTDDPGHLPYGSRYAWIPVIRQGWIGVYLFFLISGYVIFMTLEKCSGLSDFLQRRWLRLFPAMLLPSALIYLVSQAIGAYTRQDPAQPIDLLPGLSFISPSFWHAGLHINPASLDGVFWTLYVEVGFYVVIGALFFRLGGTEGWHKAISALVALWVAVVFASALIDHLPKTPLSRVIEPFQWAGVQHYGWFASGALFFKAHELRSNRLFHLAILLAIASSVTYSNFAPLSVEDRALLISSAMLFVIAQRWRALQRLLETRPILFVGFISYPLYLLHNKMGVALMALAEPVIPASVMFVLPVAMMIFMFFLAWIVASQFEPRLRAALRHRLVALRLQTA